MIHKRMIFSKKNHHWVGLVRNGWISWESKACIFCCKCTFKPYVCIYVESMTSCSSLSQLVWCKLHKNAIHLKAFLLLHNFARRM
jgi:hypothetical protein